MAENTVGITTNRALRRQLAYVVAQRQQSGRLSERPSSKVSVESGDDDARSCFRRFGAELDQVWEELRFVDAYDVNVFV